MLSGGDQLTCERHYCAQRHLMVGDTPRDCLRLFEPVCEDWHALMCFLMVIIIPNYSQKFSPEVFTLFCPLLSWSKYSHTKFCSGVLMITFLMTTFTAWVKIYSTEYFCFSGRQNICSVKVFGCMVLTYVHLCTLHDINIVKMRGYVELRKQPRCKC